MKILILHLSDIHIRAKKESNHILARAGAIAATLNEYPSCDIILIAISGDIAFSGKSEEFETAKTFFASLSEGITRNLGSKPIHFAIVPGNHDCDFSTTDTVRNSVIFSLKEGQPASDGKVIRALTVAQDAFFDFAKSYSPSTYANPPQQLLSELKIQIADQSILINCINTAWMSELHEKQGTLIAPVTVGPNQEKADLVISIFHHPFNWFAAESARQFRSFIESSSDVILTGHEHVVGHTSQAGIDGESNELIEGGELQGDGHSTASQFNIVLVDSTSKQFEVNQYLWKKTEYFKDKTSGIKPLRRNQRLQQIHFPISDEFQEYLNDPGVNLTHPRESNLTLDQIFVYPDFKRVGPSSDPNSPVLVGGVKLIDELIAAKRVLFTGNEKSGKTSLAKRLFFEYHKNGMVPILLQGRDINTGTENRLKRLVAAAVEQQYSNDSGTRYAQTPQTARVVLIDDFQHASLNAQGKDEFLNLLADHAAHLVLFTDDLTPLGDMVSVATNPGPLFKSTILQIMEMGFAKREQIIKRWVSLGQEHSISDEDLIRETNRIANGISNMLLQNVIPAHPLTIISIIQLHELNSPNKTAQGTYGYFYEMMLTSAIGRTWKAHDVDKIYTYLSAFAYELFGQSIPTLSHDKLKIFSAEYNKTYATIIDLDDTLKKLCDCRILTRTSDSYEFRYKYLYYYFVARYFRDNLDDPESGEAIRTHIERMTAAVYVEEHSNILIFFSYLVKTPIIIDAILKNAKELYKEHSWCDMEGDVAFVTSSPLNQLKFSIDATDAKVSRQEALQRRDERVLDKTAPDEHRMQHQTLELQKINAAFKTLEILGQIARNFSGSLKADVKTRLTEECYGLGLRTLRVWLTAFQTNAPLLRRYLNDFLNKEEGPVADATERDKQITMFIFVIVEIFSFSILKKISSSVGTEELAEIYSRILNLHPTKSVELLNIAIKLDHFNHTPMQEILDFHKLNEGDYFLTTMLKLMVLEHLYMFPVERESRNRLCDKLGIAKNNPLMISDDQKKYKQS